ncbi:MAG: hypothetical protein DRI69_06890 [Bacteroidetes bacterium]|nr:MAG: hypothetical protein DRI69_06890 [Bacteroidota bacterium]
MYSKGEEDGKGNKSYYVSCDYYGEIDRFTSHHEDPIGSAIGFFFLIIRSQESVDDVFPQHNDLGMHRRILSGKNRIF